MSKFSVKTLYCLCKSNVSCALPHTRCPTAMLADICNKRSEVREFRLGGKFLVKPASRLGRFMVTNGFFHSEEHPEKIEYI